MTREKFQFRNKDYYVDDVVKNVLDIVSDNSFREWCNDKIDKSVAKVTELRKRRRVAEPDWEEKMVKFYGREYFEKRMNDDISKAKKSAVTECINRAFGNVMGGGSTTNPFVPESVEAIDKEVVEKTLTRIRGIRKRTVQRKWSGR